MSTFVKKATSAVAGLAMVFTVVSPIAGVSAALSGVEAANTLGSLGVIVDQSANPAEYRLGDNLPRREAVKTMMNLSSISVTDACSGQFNDLDASDWGCKYAETALANGLVAANASFRPNELVSKIETLKMVFQGRDLERDDNADWRAGYVSAAVSMGIADSFSDYDTPATRAEMFIWAAEAINMNEEVATEEDPLCDLLGICDTEEEGETGSETGGEVEGETPTTSLPTVSGDLSVSLSPNTPVSATIPGNVNGVRVAAYDVTAGSSDVTVSQISVRRTGLSDEDTLDQLAIFTDAGRISNAQSDNQDNDTIAQINLDDGGLVVQAGETVTLYVVVDVESTITADGDTFAIEISDIRSNASDVDLSGDLRGNTFEVGSIDAPLLVISPSGSVSNPNLGETGADIFEFEIEGADDEDVILQSITFEANGDAEDNLRNFELRLGNDVVATTAAMIGDYLTFTFDGGLTIEEDKNEDFTVRADVVDGAGEDLEFSIDERLDVQADSTKFGFGASADITEVDEFGELGTVEIEAGELTLVEIEAELDEIREDKDNIVLGGFEVINLSGEHLELEDFGVKITLDSVGSAIVDINGNNTADTGETIFVETVFDDVELYNTVTGSSYDLDPEVLTTLSTVFSDNNIDAPVATGTTLWQIRADTAEDIIDFEDVRISIDVNVGEDVIVRETDDDTRVDDITPGTLSFNTIDGSESGADVSLISLADLDIVRGATDVEALAFEVEADESSDIIVDELTVRIVDGNLAPATRLQISAIRLYGNSISDANELDVVSGSDIGTAGDVTFDDMEDFFIAANDEVNFFVTVSFVDADDTVAGSNGDVGYTVSLAELSVDDDENDDVTIIGDDGNVLELSAVATHFRSARQLVVNNAGQIVTVFLDTANEDNEFDKLALAGDSTIIASFDVRADNEEVDVETVTFTLTNNGADAFAPRDVFESAGLLLNGVLVETGSNSDIDSGTVAAAGTFEITFEDMDDLILPETTAELALQLNTANIGEDFTGVSVLDLVVSDIVFADAEGAESGEDLNSAGADGIQGDNPATTGVDESLDDEIAQFGAAGISRSLDIVPAVVTPSVVSTFGTDDQTAELRLVVDGGNNTDATGDAVQAELTQLTIAVSSLTADGTITVFNGNGTQVSTVVTVDAAAVAAGDIVIAITDAPSTDGDSIGNDNEIYRIEGTAEAIYRLATDGVSYTVNGELPVISTQLENTILIGQYADSN